VLLLHLADAHHMFDGIQFHFELGETTVMVCLDPRSRLR